MANGPCRRYGILKSPAEEAARAGVECQIERLNDPTSRKPKLQTAKLQQRSHAKRHEEIVELVKVTFIINRPNAAMVRSAMEAEGSWVGLGTMDEPQQQKVPRDCEGFELQPMQLVQIREVPSYLFAGFLAGSDGEIEIARKIKSLERGYGLIVAPVDYPDLAWCSKDKDYVFLMCRTSIREAGGQPSVWTYEEYFPANCLRLLPTNIFLQALFLGSPWPAANGESQFAEYVERIVGMSIADLQKYHSLCVRSILEATDIKRQGGD